MFFFLTHLIYIAVIQGYSVQVNESQTCADTVIMWWLKSAGFRFAAYLNGN